MDKSVSTVNVNKLNHVSFVTIPKLELPFVYIHLLLISVNTNVNVTMNEVFLLVEQNPDEMVELTLII